MAVNQCAIIRLIVLCIAALTAASAFFTAQTAACRHDGRHPGMVAFVQITIMRLDAGEQTFEAFRILQNDVVEWARWNSGGLLLDHAPPFRMNSHIFNQVLSTPSFSTSPDPEPEDGTLGRPAFKLDMAFLSDAGVKRISLPDMPEDIAHLIKELRGVVHENTIPPPPGWYVWTQPYPSVHDPYVDLSEDRCDSPVCRAVLRAVRTGELIVKADNRIQRFISGGRSHRIAFSVKVSMGGLLFGVLTRP